MEADNRLMSGKTMSYMVAAVVVGYLLIASLPDRLAMYASPVTLKGPEGGPMLSGEGDPESGVLKTLTPYSDEQRTLEGQDAYTDLIDLHLFTWWALDLAVALSVYWVARRRLL